MITREMIEANLREIMSRRKESCLDKIPEGWVTVAYASKIIGLSKNRTRGYLSGSGVAKKEFRVLSGGNIRPVPHYFLGKKFK